MQNNSVYCVKLLCRCLFISISGNGLGNTISKSYFIGVINYAHQRRVSVYEAIYNVITCNSSHLHCRHCSECQELINDCESKALDAQKIQKIHQNQINQRQQAKLLPSPALNSTYKSGLIKYSFSKVKIDKTQCCSCCRPKQMSKVCRK